MKQVDKQELQVIDGVITIKFSDNNITYEDFGICCKVKGNGKAGIMEKNLVIDNMNKGILLDELISFIKVQEFNISIEVLEEFVEKVINKVLKELRTPEFILKLLIKKVVPIDKQFEILNDYAKLYEYIAKM